MNSTIRRIAVAVGVVVGAVAFTGFAVAGPAQAATVKGVVVHHNTRAHSFTVAGKTGALRAVHANRLPRVGRHVTVRARRLRNGTFAASRIRVGARRSRVRIRGTVTQVDRSGGAFVLSSRGVSLVVRHRRAGRAAAADALPNVGDVVTVDANLDDSGDLQSATVDNHGEDNGTIELEGIVQAVDATTGTLTISGDDDGGSGSLTVLLPAGFDSSVYTVGDPVELRVTLNPDGTYTAVGSSGDHGVHQADNASDDQGDNHGDGEHRDPTVADATATCQAQQSDPNFAASHDGKSFAQYYTPEDTMSSFDKCVDENSHGQSSDGGSSGGSGSDGGSDGGGSDG